MQFVSTLAPATLPAYPVRFLLPPGMTGDEGKGRERQMEMDSGRDRITGTHNATARRSGFRN